MRKFLQLCLWSAFLALPSVASAAGNKAFVCHLGKTLYIGRSAVPAHLNHGDDAGRCEAMPKSMVILRCDALEGAIVVTAASFSGYVPQPLVVNVGIGCSEAIAVAMRYGFKLENTIAGNEGGRFISEHILTGYGKSYRYNEAR